MDIGRQFTDIVYIFLFSANFSFHTFIILSYVYLPQRSNVYQKETIDKLTINGEKVTFRKTHVAESNSRPHWWESVVEDSLISYKVRR